MNRHIVIALSIVAGIGIGAVIAPRPLAASGAMIYGQVSGTKLSGEVPLVFEIRDPKSERLVARRHVEVSINEGRYLTDIGESVPDGLYAVTVLGPTALPLQDPTFVQLQAGSPGAKQTGNVNLSGTLLAGRIGVPTVNAGAMINAQATPGLIGVRGQSDATGVVGASSSGAGTGVSGVATSQSGTATGVNGTTASPTGFGVRGRGAGIGVMAETNASNLPAVQGVGHGLGALFTADDLGSFGVKGESTGEKGRGVVGSCEFGVTGTGTSIGILGDGFIGVNGKGTGFGGTFESTGDEGIAVEATTTKQFAVALNARSTGPTSKGVVGSGTSVGGHFSTSGDASSAVVGDARGQGIVFGGDFGSTSPEGRGVRGKATATSGANFGGWFTSASPSGTGAIGTVNSVSGNTIGIFGTVNSVSGKGVFGEASSPTGTTFGGDFVANSTSGTAVRGRSTATSGFTRAAEFLVASPSGNGILATATSPTGNPIAIQANSSAPGGVVGTFNGSAGSGNVIGLRSQVASESAKAILAQHFASGTNIEIGSPNGAVMYDKGHINKKFGSSFFTMSPIAYGVVNSNGTKAGGTSNWTVSQSQSSTKTYFINLTGDELVVNNFVCQVTQVGGSISDARLLPLTTFDEQGPNIVSVSWQTLGAAFASTKFQFVIYGKIPVAAQPPPGP